jgi:hypothetical protein
LQLEFLKNLVGKNTPKCFSGPIFVINQPFILIFSPSESPQSQLSNELFYTKNA